MAAAWSSAGGASDTPTDTDLVRAAQRGENDAFARLVMRYDVDVRRVTRGLVRDRDDAEDVRQEVWLRIAERISTAAPDTFRGWVRAIARNACLNFLRTHASRARVTDADAGAKLLLVRDENTSDAPERSVLAQDLRREVWEAVGGLSDDDRTVLRLRELEERSYGEIAGLLRTTPHAAEVRTHRARRRLRRALEALVTAPRPWHLNPLKVTSLVDDAPSAALPDHVTECATCADDIATVRRGRDLFGGLGALILLPREVAALASRLRGLIGRDADVVGVSNVVTTPVALPASVFVQASGVAVTAAFVTAVLAPFAADAGVGETASIEPESVASPAPALRASDVLRVADVTVTLSPDAGGPAVDVEATAVAEPASRVSALAAWSERAAPATSGAVADTGSASPSKGATVSAAVRVAVAPANTRKATDEERSSAAPRDEEHRALSAADARARMSAVATATSPGDLGPGQIGMTVRQHRGKP